MNYFIPGMHTKESMCILIHVSKCAISRTSYQYFYIMCLCWKRHFMPSSIFYTYRWNNLLGNNQFYYRLCAFCIWSTSVTVSRGSKWRDSIVVTYLLQMSTASCCLSVRCLNKYGHPWQMTYWTAPQRVKTPESTSTGHRSDTNGGKKWRGTRLRFSIGYLWLREI